MKLTEKVREILEKEIADSPAFCNWIKFAEKNETELHYSVNDDFTELKILHTQPLDGCKAGVDEEWIISEITQKFGNCDYLKWDGLNESDTMSESIAHLAIEY